VVVSPGGDESPHSLREKLPDLRHGAYDAGNPPARDFLCAWDSLPEVNHAPARIQEERGDHIPAVEPSGHGCRDRSP
jgi:hypothetical protein